MFLKRYYQKELMDDFSIQDERIDAALTELKVTNRYLGGISTTREGLNLLLKEKREKGNGKLSGGISILDVGAGASDILLFLKNKFPSIKITSIDLNKRVCKFLWRCNSAGERNSVKRIICADSMNIPIKEKQFDIVHASLFLHHFNEEKIKKMITGFLKITGSGIIINDLRRSVLALLGIRIISKLFSKSDMFKNDGPLSVKRGFVKSDLLKILNEIGLNNFKLKRKWAFRWLLVIYK